MDTILLSTQRNNQETPRESINITIMAPWLRTSSSERLSGIAPLITWYKMLAIRRSRNIMVRRPEVILDPNLPPPPSTISKKQRSTSRQSSWAVRRWRIELRVGNKKSNQMSYSRFKRWKLRRPEFWRMPWEPRIALQMRSKEPTNSRMEQRWGLVAAAQLVAWASRPSRNRPSQRFKSEAIALRLDSWIHVKGEMRGQALARWFRIVEKTDLNRRVHQSINRWSTSRRRHPRYSLLLPAHKICSRNSWPGSSNSRQYRRIRTLIKTIVFAKSLPCRSMNRSRVTRRNIEAKSAAYRSSAPSKLKWMTRPVSSSNWGRYRESNRMWMEIVIWVESKLLCIRHRTWRAARSVAKAPPRPKVHELCREIDSVSTSSTTRSSSWTNEIRKRQRKRRLKNQE